jgi:exosome complex component RRP43
MAQQQTVSAELEALVHQKLYPDLHFQQCAACGCHEDGRPTTSSRPATIAVGSNPSVDGSALIKLGDTTVLALVRLEVMVPKEDAPDQGAFQISVEMSPISYPDARRGKDPPIVPVISQALQDVLGSPQVFDTHQLCISEGQAVWVVYLDVYVLNACGSLLDGCLLAAVAALRSTHLPAVHLTDEGNVERGAAEDDEDGSNGSPAAAAAAAAAAAEQGGTPLQLSCTPLALTVGLYGQQQFIDPNHLEEEQMEALVTTVVNEHRMVLGECCLCCSWIEQRLVLRTQLSNLQQTPSMQLQHSIPQACSCSDCSRNPNTCTTTTASSSGSSSSSSSALTPQCARLTTLTHCTPVAPACTCARNVQTRGHPCRDPATAGWLHRRCTAAAQGAAPAAAGGAGSSTGWAGWRR